MQPDPVSGLDKPHCRCGNVSVWHYQSQLSKPRILLHTKANPAPQTDHKSHEGLPALIMGFGWTTIAPPSGFRSHVEGIVAFHVFKSHCLLRTFPGWNAKTVILIPIMEASELGCGLMARPINGRWVLAQGCTDHLKTPEQGIAV